MIIYFSTGHNYITQVNGDIQVLSVGVDSVVDWVFICCDLHVTLLLFLVIYVFFHYSYLHKWVKSHIQYACALLMQYPYNVNELKIII